MPLRYAPVLLLLLACFSCQPKEHLGNVLAQTYCGTCHLMPEPELLPKAIWEKTVLPIMSGYLGFIKGQDILVPTVSPDNRRRIAQSGIFPDGPVISEEQWALLRSYFLDNAPDSLPAQAAHTLNITLTESFSLTPVVIPDPEDITFLKPDPSSGELWYGTRDGVVAALNQNKEVTAHYKVKSTPADVAFTDDKMMVVTMGIMNPAEAYLGKLVTFNRKGGEQEPVLFAENINRPVEIAAVNLVGDEKPEWIVCEYGNFLGSLFWLGSEENGVAGQMHVLRGVSGARSVTTTDYNHDGKMDFVVLFAQGNESVVLYENTGEGHFTEHGLLRFAPVYGSGFFELVDMNGDGFDDIIYTNGDNGDYSQVLKPYHGVRIYLNDGKWNFTEKWFYPMHGASKTVTRDFDGDGDLDIAAISFFPDSKNHPEEGFIFFENTGPLTFNALADRKTAAGRWMVMTAADMDGDGIEDVVLGSALRVPRMGFVQQPDLEPVQTMVVSKKK